MRLAIVLLLPAAACVGSGANCPQGTELVDGICTCPDAGPESFSCTPAVDAAIDSDAADATSDAFSDAAADAEASPVDDADTLDAASDADTLAPDAADGSDAAASAPRKVIQVEARGYDHTCALLDDGSVQCWGSNESGQLGVPLLNSNEPQIVPGLSGVTQLSAGEDFTCARLDNATVSCWGNNDFGQLGDGTNTSRIQPEVIAGLEDVASIAARRWGVCAALTTGDVKCWGGTFGEGGTPTAVDIAGVEELASGDGFSCAHRATGSVECWGENAAGQLGDGSKTDRPAPVAVTPALGSVASLATGGAHACALLADGTAKCWGHDGRGAVGNGTPESDPAVQVKPVAVIDIEDIRRLWAGDRLACALLDDGWTVMCWGAEPNLAGDPALAPPPEAIRHAPVPVPKMFGATSVSAGATHVCFIYGEVALKCFGQNASGQLGDGTQESRSEPVTVSLL